MENETINNRINTICSDMYGGNFSAFAKAVNIPPTTLRALADIDRRGDNPQAPKLKQLESIINGCGVCTDWLLWGRGVMMPTQKEDAPAVADTSCIKYDFNNIGGTHTHAPEPNNNNSCYCKSCDELRAQIRDMQSTISALVNTNRILAEQLSSMK